MPKLIIINGPPSIGKTTVAELVFQKLESTALLDGDDVWRINPFVVTDSTTALAERNISCTLRGYLEAGYEHVLLAWVMHRQDIIDRVVTALGDLEFDLHVFTLVSDEATLCERYRRGTGADTAPPLLVERLLQARCLETTHIDTSALTPMETADWIVTALSP